MENSNSFIDPRRGRLLFPRSSPPPPALPSLPLPPLPPPRYSYEMSLNVSYAPTSFQNKQWRLQPSIDSVGCKRISPWPLPPDGSRAAAGRGSLGTGGDGAAAARLSPAAARGDPRPGGDGAQLPGSRLLGGSLGGTLGQEEGAGWSRRGERGRLQAEPQSPGGGSVTEGTPGAAAAGRGPPPPPPLPPAVSRAAPSRFSSPQKSGPRPVRRAGRRGCRWSCRAPSSGGGSMRSAPR